MIRWKRELIIFCMVIVILLYCMANLAEMGLK